MQKREDLVHRGVGVTIVSTIASIALAAVKLGAGLVGNSQALVSDAVNSIGDIASYLAVAGGLAVSGKRPDAHHQYGHDKMESVVSVLLSLAVLATGCAIGWRGILTVSRPASIAIPTVLPLVGAGISIVTKLVLWRYTAACGKRTGLNALKALATDHASDVLGSTGALAGIIGARMGLPVLDPIASIVIAALIIRSSFTIFREAVNVLLDMAVDSQTSDAVKTSILSTRGVLRIDLLRTRSVGPRYYVEVEIGCDGKLSLNDAHGIAQEVHDRIEHDFPRVKHVMVHVNPV